MQILPTPEANPTLRPTPNAEGEAPDAGVAALFARLLDVTSGATPTAEEATTLDVDDDDVLEEEDAPATPPPLRPGLVPLPAEDEPLLAVAPPATAAIELDAPLRAPALELVRFLAREGIEVERRTAVTPKEAPAFTIAAEEVVGTPDLLPAQDLAPPSAGLLDEPSFARTPGGATDSVAAATVEARAEADPAPLESTESDDEPARLAESELTPIADPEVAAPSASHTAPAVDPATPAHARHASAVDVAAVPASGPSIAPFEQTVLEPTDRAVVEHAAGEARRLLDEAREISRRHAFTTARRLTIDLPVERGAPVRLTIAPDQTGHHRIALVASTQVARDELERHREQIERIVASFPIEVTSVSIDAAPYARQDASRTTRGAR